MKTPVATVITLRDRPDRITKFQSWWDKSPFPNVELIVLFAEKSERGGKYGCVESHYGSLRAAQEKSPDFPSIHFEDDAQPTALWFNTEKQSQIFSEIEMVMKADPDWAVIGLGGTPLSFSDGIHDLPGHDFKHMKRVSFIEAHAFMVSPKFRRQLLTNPDFTGHLDYRMATLTRLHSYLVWDQLFEQDEAAGSDNSSNLKHFIKFRKAFKRLHFEVGRRTNIPWRYAELALIFVVMFLYAHSTRKIRGFFGILALVLVSLHVANCGFTDTSFHVKAHPFQVGVAKLDRLVIEAANKDASKATDF